MTLGLWSLVESLFVLLTGPFGNAMDRSVSSVENRGTDRSCSNTDGPPLRPSKQRVRARLSASSGGVRTPSTRSRRHTSTAPRPRRTRGSRGPVEHPPCELDPRELTHPPQVSLWVLQEVVGVHDRDRSPTARRFLSAAPPRGPKERPLDVTLRKRRRHPRDRGSKGRW